MKEISCATFESRINDLLDARQDPANDEGFIRHSDRCANCKAVFADYLALDDSVSNVVWDAETLARLAAPTYRFPAPQTLVVGLPGRSFADRLQHHFRISPWRDNSNSSPTAPHLPSIAVNLPQPDQEQRQHLAPRSIEPETTEPQLTPVSWNELSERLQPVLNPYYQISAELPGIRPIQSSLYLTIAWVQENILKRSASPEPKQGFGQFLRTG